MADEKLSLNDAAARLKLTPEQLKKMVADGDIKAQGTGDALVFNADDLPGAPGTDKVITLDEGGSEDFTLKLQDEGSDTDLTAAVTPPPTPAASLRK